MDDLPMSFGSVAIPKRKKTKAKSAPVSTICPTCLRFSSAHSMREKRACAQGIDDRDEAL